MKQVFLNSYQVTRCHITSTLKVQAVCFCDMRVTIYKTARHHVTNSRKCCHSTGNGSQPEDRQPIAQYSPPSGFSLTSKPRCRQALYTVHCTLSSILRYRCHLRSDLQLASWGALSLTLVHFQRYWKQSPFVNVELL